MHLRGIATSIPSPIGQWRPWQRVWTQERWRIWPSSGQPSLEDPVIRAISVFSFFFILQCVKSDIVLPGNLQVAVRLTAVCWAGPPAYDVPDLQHKSLGLTPGSKFDYFLDYLAPCCWNKTVFDKEWSMLSQLFTMLGCVSSSTQLPSGLFHVHWVAHLTQAAPPSPSCPHTPWCVPSKFHYGQEHAPHFW